MTTPQPPLNPYAATIVDDDAVAADEAVAIEKTCSTVKVCVDTTAMISLSGGFFAALVILFSMFSAWPVANLQTVITAIGSLLLGGVISFLIGAILALLAAIPVVTLGGWLISIQPNAREPWTPSGIRVFGSITGALSGFSCLGVPLLLAGAFQGLFVAIMPAAFAAGTVPLLLFRTVRHCRNTVRHYHDDRSGGGESQNFDFPPAPSPLPPVDFVSRKLP